MGMKEIVIGGEERRERGYMTSHGEGQITLIMSLETSQY